MSGTTLRLSLDEVLLLRRALLAYRARWEANLASSEDRPQSDWIARDRMVAIDAILARIPALK